MKKAWLYSLLTLFSFLNLSGQDNLPPVYGITSDTTLLDTLPGKYWQMLEDKEGQLTIHEVQQSPYTGQFFYRPANRINRKTESYWLRFVLQNKMDHAVRIGFYDSYMRSSDWYIITSSGDISHKLSGEGTPWSKRDDLKLINFISISIKTGETLTVYQRISFNYLALAAFSQPDSLFVTYGFTDKVIAENYVNNESHYFWSLQDSFLFGALLLAAMFNFFFFVIVKERVYIYFALYVFFLGFGRFMGEREFFYAFLKEHPLIYYDFNAFYWFSIDLFLALFIRSLLQIKRYFLSWDKVIVLFTCLMVTGVITSCLIDYYLIGTDRFGLRGWFIMLPLMTLHLGLVITFLLFLKKDIGLKRILLVAILPSFVTWAVLDDTYHFFFSILQPQFHLKPNAFLNWLYDNWNTIECICLGWQVLWFAWFLLQRFIELRNQIVQKELEKELERSQLIEQQRAELEKTVTERTSDLTRSLQNLKSTQAQLIQSEKMASLGELTAGIAHEIQNPLNFVNNFSDVNKELLEELKEEAEKGNIEEIKAIANDVINNEEKINHHGRRADAIVKNMLQHSRSSGATKELTDINKLADEYLRLSYHGLRAKDKSFNADFKTEFDASIDKINIVPQDIGRVLLNLVNNAFYAVSEKERLQASGYKPQVTVRTRKLGDRVEIDVADNGNGIPKKIVEKIFQPFFTTKPAGQGTGLGLSLSYDIIKAHGGEIKVKTKENEGSEFIIQLPLNNTP